MSVDSSHAQHRTELGCMGGVVVCCWSWSTPIQILSSIHHTSTRTKHRSEQICFSSHHHSQHQSRPPASRSFLWEVMSQNGWILFVDSIEENPLRYPLFSFSNHLDQLFGSDLAGGMAFRVDPNFSVVEPSNLDWIDFLDLTIEVIV